MFPPPVKNGSFGAARSTILAFSTGSMREARKAMNLNIN